MGEQEPRVSADKDRQVPEFGQPAGGGHPASMFDDGSDLPIFSGTPIPAIERPFVPEDHTWKQAALPGMPAIDYDAVLVKDKALRQRRRSRGQAQEGAALLLPVPGEPIDPVPRQIFPPEPLAEFTANARSEQRQRVQELVLPYIDLVTLRRLAATGEDIRHSLRAAGEVPEEISAILDTIAALLRPSKREQIKSPADVAALLMVQMGNLDQEELRTVLLDTKNRVQDIVTIYRGSLNTSLIRVGEIFKEALKRNSAGIIVAHNHPSSDVTPSPEDVLVTHEILKASKILDVEFLDHLIIGGDKWLSMREKGLVWNR